MSITLWENYSDEIEGESPLENVKEDSTLGEATMQIFLRKYKGTGLSEEKLKNIFKECHFNDEEIQKHLKERLNTDSKSYVVVDNPFNGQKVEEFGKKNSFYERKNYSSSSASYERYQNRRKNYGRRGGYYKSKGDYRSYNERKTYYQNKFCYAQEIEFSQENSSNKMEKDSENGETESEKNSKESDALSKNTDNENETVVGKNTSSTENNSFENVKPSGQEESLKIRQKNENEGKEDKEEKEEQSRTYEVPYFDYYYRTPLNLESSSFFASSIGTNYVLKSVLFNKEGNLYGNYFMDSNMTRREKQKSCWERVAMYYEIPASSS